MKKIIDLFKNEKIAVHCTNEQDAKQFIKLCYKNNMDWGCGLSNETSTNWGYCDNDICYEFNNGHLYYGSYEGFEFTNYKIIAFDEFIRNYVTDYLLISEDR